jgi:uncharacterized protein involved in exopolysaccharide biosynthesis/Mrp family chromosome partitioning ATPase
MTQHQPQKTQIEQFTDFMARRWRFIMTFGVIGATLALCVGFLVPPRYIAKAQISIGPPLRISNDESGNVSTDVSESEIETHVTMISSRDHLAKVRADIISMENAARSSAPVQDGHINEGYTTGIPGANASPGDNGIPSLDELKRKLKVYQERRSRVIAVAFTSSNAKQAAAIANQIAVQYVARYGDRRKVELREVFLQRQLDWLNKRLSLIRAKLTQQEHKLGTLRSIPMDKLSVADLNELLDDATHNFAQDQTAQLKALIRSSDIHIRSQAKLLPVRKTLVIDNTQVLRELQRLVTQLDADNEIARGQVQALERHARELAAASETMHNIDARDKGAAPEFDSKRPFFDALLTYQTSTASRFHNADGVRLLTNADAPAASSSPNPLLFVMPAIIAFSILGGIFANVSDRMDTRMRDPGEVSRLFGIPSLGLMPKLSKFDRIQLYHDIRRKPFAEYTEAIRSAASFALANAPREDGTNAVLVTSTLGGEGKTTLAISLAAHAARIKRRTVLVDLAFRHPSLLSCFGNKTSTDVVDVLDVLDVLAGLPVDEAVLHVNDAGFDYLPLQASDYEPMLHLKEDDLRDMLRRLREQYELVIIDSGPLLGVTETRFLIPMVDKVLVAVKWGATNRKFVEHAFRTISFACEPGKCLSNAAGVVFTHVNLKKHASYRYGDIPT